MKSRAARFALTLLLGLAFGPARTLSASAFRVTPIRIDFDRTTQSALLTLINESTEALRFQVSAFTWGQAPTGEMKLQPTKDIVFFPALLSLKAGEERKIRIGRTAPQGAIEKTYRVFFEELPPIEKQSEPKRGSQVRILTKIGVPIFVAPEKDHVAGEITSLKAAQSKLSFDVRNTGNVHFMVQSLRVTAFDDQGKQLFQKEREGWYVLSGDARAYDLDLTTEKDCQKIQKVKIDAVTDVNFVAKDSALHTEYVLPQTACGSARK